VVGGGDSTAEAACFLSRDNKVTPSYRRREFFRINEPNLCTQAAKMSDTGDGIIGKLDVCCGQS
jgi:thioredoxin reductase